MIHKIQRCKIGVVKIKILIHHQKEVR